MTKPISTAIVFAAGFGKRLQPITLSTPKPLVKIANKPLLDYAIDHLQNAGVTKIIVNTHHLATSVADHIALKQRANIHVVFEPEILETGGGIKNAQTLLGDDPIFAINSDSLWQDGTAPALQRLQDCWNPQIMDGLLMLFKTEEIPLNQRDTLHGDFFMEADGRLRRREQSPRAPFTFMGVQIVKPELIYKIRDHKFSLNKFYDQAISQHRLFGVVHDGKWFHISTPADLAETEKDFKPL